LPFPALNPRPEGELFEAGVYGGAVGRKRQVGHQVEERLEHKPPLPEAGMRYHEPRILPDLISDKQQVDVQGSRTFWFEALPPKMPLHIQSEAKQGRSGAVGEGEGHRVPVVRLGQRPNRLAPIQRGDS
jgi:hypothetical protein